MQRFDTPDPISAVVEIPAGRVRFIAADRADSAVEVLPANAAKGRDVKAAEQTAVDFGDGVLRIKAAPGGRALGQSGAVEVTVKLPAGSHVKATTGAAELRAVGRLGDVVFDGAYRSVRIDEAADVHLTASDGDVEVGRLTGSADISTMRGDITITEAAGGKVVLRTRSGDISIGAAAGVSAALDAGTAYGRIDNALKNDGAPRLDIRATTSHGDITARSL
ncbi:DUF4097 family beta strand repeat-containing protein [Actinomadura chibensis]|uniref:DUF4097 domain-containing protein n=1 Tax=Actinomadura chibensis TaxID=392828 RepID=A0A5D0NUP3_9ACTN|nr:DUF4097 family beta strand repeat-containing protein [Actinomadura chibensis]TYB47972.1 DUF4097 domain-containing protein [Actinomadura chibensis]